MRILIQKKFFFKGELYHGQRRSGPNLVNFTIRVYPFIHYELRTHAKCTQFVQELINRSNRTNNNSICTKAETQSKKLKKKKDKKIDVYGHLGKFFY